MMFTIFDRLGTLKEQKLAISALRLIIVDWKIKKSLGLGPTNIHKVFETHSSFHVK